MIVRPFDVGPLNRHYDGAYDESAMRWGAVAAMDKADNLIRLLADRPVTSVLEVGCGTGAVLARLAQRGVGTSHVGVDLANPSVHVHPNAQALDLRQYDGENLPFGDETFDLVYATHVVEHVYNPRAFLKELKRVSRRWIYVEVPCEARAFVNRGATQASLDTGHINIYNPESFMILLQSVGYEVERLELFDHSLDVVGFGVSKSRAILQRAVRQTALRLNPLLASRLFCYHCGALAVRRPSSADHLGQRDDVVDG
jgi:SAM-dependent methyltransferase